MCIEERTNRNIQMRYIVHGLVAFQYALEKICDVGIIIPHLRHNRRPVFRLYLTNGLGEDAKELRRKKFIGNVGHVPLYMFSNIEYVILIQAVLYIRHTLITTQYSH